MAGPVSHVFTSRAHGDLATGVAEPDLTARRNRIAPGPWSVLRQVHGANVVVVDRPGGGDGAAADAAVTVVGGVTLSVRTADCAPLLLSGPHGFGVVHAGWRGLVTGVVEAAASSLAGLGAAPTVARLGPCIEAACYEFGAEDLDRVAARYGDGVRGLTTDGRPALDLAAGVRSACAAVGLDLVTEGCCTACSPDHWSHRCGGDPERQGLVAWMAP